MLQLTLRTVTSRDVIGVISRPNSRIPVREMMSTYSLLELVDIGKSATD